MSGWANYRDLIAQNFGVVMAIAFVIGLFVPGIEHAPKFVVAVILGIIIFFSCSKIRMDDFRAFRALDVALVVVVRFIILPLAIYCFADHFLPTYKFGLLLLGLLPCGVTLPAMMTIMGGNAALGLSAVTITSFIVPFTIPLFFYLLADMSVEIDIAGMFFNLLVTIFVPVVLYFGFMRRFKRAASLMRENSSALACLLISGMIAIVVAYERDVFFQDFGFVLSGVIIGGVTYVLFYLTGLAFAYKSGAENRISYSLLSGCNNTGLGISVAVLFLTPSESVLIIIWEINWIFCLILFQQLIKRKYI